MVDYWSIAAHLMFALLGGALVGTLSLLIGGVGGLSKLRTEHRALTADVELLDERLTRDQKRRGGEAAADKRAEKARTEAEIMQEAHARLLDGPGPGGNARPSARPRIV